MDSPNTQSNTTQNPTSSTGSMGSGQESPSGSQGMMPPGDGTSGGTTQAQQDDSDQGPQNGAGTGAEPGPQTGAGDPGRPPDDGSGQAQPTDGSAGQGQQASGDGQGQPQSGDGQAQQGANQGQQQDGGEGQQAGSGGEANGSSQGQPNGAGQGQQAGGNDQPNSGEGQPNGAGQGQQAGADGQDQQNGGASQQPGGGSQSPPRPSDILLPGLGAILADAIDNGIPGAVDLNAITDVVAGDVQGGADANADANDGTAGANVDAGSGDTQGNANGSASLVPVLATITDLGGDAGLPDPAGAAGDLLDLGTLPGAGLLAPNGPVLGPVVSASNDAADTVSAPLAVVSNMAGQPTASIIDAATTFGEDVGLGNIGAQPNDLLSAIVGTPDAILNGHTGEAVDNIVEQTVRTVGSAGALVDDLAGSADGDLFNINVLPSAGRPVDNALDDVFDNTGAPAIGAIPIVNLGGSSSDGLLELNAISDSTHSGPLIEFSLADDNGASKSSNLIGLDAGPNDDIRIANMNILSTSESGSESSLDLNVVEVGGNGPHLLEGEVLTDDAFLDGVDVLDDLNVDTGNVGNLGDLGDLPVDVPEASLLPILQTSLTHDLLGL